MFVILSCQVYQRLEEIEADKAPARYGVLFYWIEFTFYCLVQGLSCNFDKHVILITQVSEKDNENFS